MPRSARARAIARLTIKWLDYGHPASVKTLRISKLPTHEDFTTADALEFRAVLDDELGERHRRHMFLRAWMQVTPRGYLQ